MQDDPAAPRPDDFARVPEDKFAPGPERDFARVPGDDLARSADDGFTPHPVDEAHIAAHILRMVAERGPARSVDPTEAARALAPEAPAAEWQRLIRPVRRVALRLAEAGQVELLRKGKPVAPGEAKGVIRLRLPAAAQ
jgi:hypothetical protein